MLLVAEKPFKYRGRDLGRGDVVEPTPEGRLLHVLLDQRKARWADADSHRDTDTRASSTVTYPCGDCDRVMVSASALENHRTVEHADSDASTPPSDASPVSTSPGAPEPVAADPSVAATGELSCPDCDRAFNGPQGLKVHRAKAHAGA